jgi:hypothetical protein
VLPGFEAVRVDGTRIELGPRTYVWSESYLPVRIESVGGLLTDAMKLVLTPTGAAPFDAKPEKVVVTGASPAHAVVVASGNPMPGLHLEVTTRVEYDGVAMVSVVLTPTRPTPITGLDFVVGVVRRDATTVMAFRAEGLRRQKGRKDMLALPYRGPFLNVINVSDGDRSFWWFADNAEGWVWGGAPVTEVGEEGKRVSIRQRLVNTGSIIDEPIRFQLNFMATPVRRLDPKWRTERILHGSPSRDEASLGAKFRLWWTGAFAHDLLPYTRLTEEQASLVGERDQKAYPGATAIRQSVSVDRRLYGLHRIPYFSAHALSVLDPVLDEYREVWEVDPPFVFQGGHPPWSKTFDRPSLSHRDPSYSDYLLYRIDKLIDETGMSGIYLDHGPPFDTRNEHHGLWLDARGRGHPSLDILGLRRFLKRLATLFYLKGEPGYIFVHASAREIIPAYAFATGIVDGEQYRRVIPDGDYISNVSLPEIRARMAPDQYGLRIDWLPTEWVNRSHDPEWEGSDDQLRSYRNFMTLVLLHGTGDWPAGAHQEERWRLIRALDSFGIGEATLRGYWGDTGVTRVRKDAAVSVYYNAKERRSLLVVANLAEVDRMMELHLDPKALGGEASQELRVRAVLDGGPIEVDGEEIRVVVPAKDFRLVVAEGVD